MPRAAAAMVEARATGCYRAGMFAWRLGDLVLLAGRLAGLLVLLVWAVGCGRSRSAGTETGTTRTPGAPAAATPGGGTEAPADSSAVAVAALGARIYARHCALCHGAGGRGDGDAAAGMKPKPRDHTDSAYMGSRTDAQLLQLIHDGKGNMPAWKRVLTEREMRAVLVHVRSLATR